MSAEGLVTEYNRHPEELLRRPRAALTEQVRKGIYVAGLLQSRRPRSSDGRSSASRVSIPVLDKQWPSYIECGVYRARTKFFARQTGGHRVKSGVSLALV